MTVVGALLLGGCYAVIAARGRSASVALSPPFERDVWTPESSCCGAVRCETHTRERWLIDGRRTPVADVFLLLTRARRVATSADGAGPTGQRRYFQQNMDMYHASFVFLRGGFSQPASQPTGLSGALTRRATRRAVEEEALSLRRRSGGRCDGLRVVRRRRRLELPHDLGDRDERQQLRL